MMKGEGFPHEMGLLLGYPVEDVIKGLAVGISIRRMIELQQSTVNTEQFIVK